MKRTRLLIESDLPLRKLERAWKSTGTPEDHAKYIKSLRRSGDHDGAHHEASQYLESEIDNYHRAQEHYNRNYFSHPSDQVRWGAKRALKKTARAFHRAATDIDTQAHHHITGRENEHPHEHLGRLANFHAAANPTGKYMWLSASHQFAGSGTYRHGFHNRVASEAMRKSIEHHYPGHFSVEYQPILRHKDPHRDPQPEWLSNSTTLLVSRKSDSS